MPKDMTNSEFGKLAGFEKGQAASSKASTVASEDVIGRLKSAGVTRELVEAWALHYAREAQRVSGQVTAVHRAPLLRDIWRKMK